MKGSRLLVAAALLLLLVSVWLLGGGAAEREEDRLFSFTPDQVSGMTLQRPDGPIIDIEKMGGAWYLVRPVSSNADRGEVEGIVAVATSAPVEKRLGMVDDLAPFGLDRPVVVTFLLSDGTGKTVRIGGMNPDQSLRYLGVGAGNEVVAVARSVGAGLFRNLFELRDKRLLTITTDAIDRIVIEGERPTVVERTADGWEMTAPYRLPASRQNVVATLATLVNLTAAGFYETAAEKAEVTLAASRAIRLESNGKETVLEVGVTDRGAAIVMIGERVARIAPDMYDALPTGAADFLDLRLLPGVEETTLRIEYRQGAMAVTLVRADDRWKLEAPVNATADKSVIEGLLHHLGWSEGETIVAGPGFDPVTYGLDKPFAEATVFAPDGIRRSVTIGRMGETYFVTATGWSWVASMGADEARSLLPATPPVDRRFFPIEAASVKKIVVERGDQRFVVEKGEHGGVMTSPTAGRLDDEPYYRFVWGTLALAYGADDLGALPTGQPAATVEVINDADETVNRVAFYRADNDHDGYRAVDLHHPRPLRIDGRVVTTTLVTLLESLMEYRHE